MTIQNTQRNGTYLISRLNSWNYDVALIPDKSDSLLIVIKMKIGVVG